MNDTWDSAPLAPAAPPTPSPVGTWDAAPLAGPSAQQKAVVSAGDNSEEAAKAVGIARRTGIPAPVVQSDLPGYDAHDKQQAAIKATQNPALAKYIDSNPMAASVSADDWGKLEEASKVIQGLGQQGLNDLSGLKAVGRIASEFSKGATEGVGEGIPPTGVSNEFIQGMQQLGFFHEPGKNGNPFQYFNEAMIMPVAAAVNSVLRSVNATLYAGAGAVGQIAEELGGPGPQVKREVINFANYLMAQSAAVPGMKPGVLPRPAAPMTVNEFLHHVAGRTTREEIDAFIKSKPEHGPVLQITKAEAGAEALDAAVEVAQDSKTKVRSPELYADMVRAHDPGNVHIDAAKIMELYQKEGKIPAEGDGLFGFVPDLATKVQAAAATGGEITIPIADYTAHIDEAVHKQVRESARLHNDGVTLEEAKEAEKSIEAYHGTPHDFEQFDLTKIGTGEGAQVYGHGLYFAENRQVATDYQSKLSPDGKITLNNGISVNQAQPMEAAKALNLNEDERFPFAYALSSLTDGKTLNEAIATIREQYPDHPGLDKAIEALRKYEPKFEVGRGQLYKVSISADPTHFLDWDKPLSEQPEAVQKFITEKMQLRFPSSDLTKFETTGDIYKKLEGFGTPKSLSKEFAEAGIPGIKYLDQGSRRADGVYPIKMKEVDGKQLWYATEFGTQKSPDFATHAEALAWSKAQATRNFVVFDENLVKIKEKNDNPVEALVEGAIEIQKQLLYLTQLFKNAKSVGITDAEFKKYSDKIQRAEQAILDKAVAVNRREAASRLTPEWKRNEAAVKDEVTEEFKTQGAFAAEKYLRDNKIDIAHERAAQVADDLAPLFGFESGQDMLRGLESIDIEKAASGKGPEVQQRDAIKAETAARMEARYGNLAENIATDARETALADHTFDILADEVRILASAAKVAPPLSRAEMVEFAEKSFEERNIRDAANWQAHQRAVSKGGRNAEKALLSGKFLEAFQAKQEQFLAAIWAKQSIALQGIIDRVERKIDRFSSEEVIKGLDQAHLEQIRQVLASLGLPQQFAPLAGTPALRDFVTGSEGQIAVAPWLMDGSQPKLQDMSVGQFRDFVKSMQSLEHVGRQVGKLFSAMKEADLQNVVFDIKKSLERFPFIDQPNNPSIPQRVGSAFRKVIGAHLLVERMLDYTDKFDPHGPLTEWLDRPLRDANTKELVLTEQVVRMLKDLRQHVDGSINDPIKNTLIPDALDKTGFLQMSRSNLRTLMLNMGNWSNIKKATEGFGVNEADLRRFIDANATAKDVAWVNGIWKVFDHLKPEADAVQLRDTGVPVDAIPAVGWDIAAGKLEGGYYPLSYDPYNSDIQGHIAQPLFDKGYFAATTPHGYTEARTEYKGAIDLTGAFLSSKIQGMVHDIAFREAVRNADKLIKNQEFRTALAQRWGKESADLLPGWIRDIANSHNLDDNYAKGFQRASALIRQNVVSTLIAYNPGTFIKHGFTALVMSVDRVGLGKLFSAAHDIGLTGTVKNLSDLLARGNRVPDEAFMDAFRDLLDQGERGENARQFVLDSSAVMRQRQRQYEDSIRGAVDKITNIGWTQSFADFRQRQMQYGRLAVALSDQMSAYPTYLAAYKKAYLAGESNADAVFIAEKEVSRAHGSSFIGDKPLVSRLSNTPTGEFMRWFTGLYNFFNHQANNNFQLVWDASAYLGGNKGGEPGANALSISRRVALVMGIIAIEEMAGPAKDEDGHGILTRSLLAGLRFFGAGFVGVREITNGLAHGYEPSTGMIGTLFKAGSDTIKDIGKGTGIKAGLAKDWITHTATAIGFMTGVGGSQLGRTGQFGADVLTGRDRPQTFNDYRQGLRTGHSKARKHR